MNSAELQKRLKKFTYDVVEICELLLPAQVSKIITGQLIRSAFSAAANYRAACNGQSRKTFVAKLSIAFEEIDESLFWLEGIRDLKLITGSERFLALIGEAGELTRILASSRKTSQQKTKY